MALCCCCYRKGTNFQANHNNSDIILECWELLLLPQRYKFSSKSQHVVDESKRKAVVVATAKVQIFKQITTGVSTGKQESSCCCYRKGTNFQANHNGCSGRWTGHRLLLLPQRYKFSSKSQQEIEEREGGDVVVATAKVQIFKQITTVANV